MSVTSCSSKRPNIPIPTIFNKASTLVCDLSMVCFLNWRKFFHPEEPASTTVVTPALNVKPSGGRLVNPSAIYASGVFPVSYTHLRAHETDSYLVCRLLLE